nr:uncharacterized protein LOC126056330 [Helicoverpa armigera]
MTFEFSLPDTMSSFISIDEALRTLQGADMETESTNTLSDDLMLKVQWKAYDYIARMLNLQRRMKNQPRPRVEYGPGAHKTELIKYPDNYIAKRLKQLIKIKEKKEEKSKKT